MQEKRKTINGEDLLNAMQALGFDQYVEPLKTYILRYRDANRLDKTTAAGMLVHPPTTPPATTSAGATLTPQGGNKPMVRFSII